MPAILNRPAPAAAPARSGFQNRSGPNRRFGKPVGPRAGGGKPKEEAKILFQKFFKSVGPRTYAAQLKEAGNGNHFLVLTEGKRDDKTGEVRKTRLFVFSEDFDQFFSLVEDLKQFTTTHPVSAEVAVKQAKYWKSHPVGSK